MAVREKTPAEQGAHPPWKPGESGNPKGRPPGSKNKLAELFWSDLYGKWQEKGVEAIDRMIADKPGDFVRVVASQMPQEHLHKQETPLSQLSDDELTIAIQQIRELIARTAGSVAGGAAVRTGDATKH